jgi:hypothetical protein
LGIPYYVNPRGGTGVSAAANVGITRSPTDSRSKAYALTGGVGAGPLFITASVGTLNPDAAGEENVSTFGGTVGMKLFGGGLMPLAIGLQAGVGYAKSDGVTLLSVPVAVGVGLNVPLFPLKPWIAPRIQFMRASATGFPSETENRMGISAGVDFNMLLGLGVHAAVDYMPKKGSGADELPASTTIGVGAHFNFRVPMM